MAVREIRVFGDPVLRTALSRVYYKLMNRLVEVELQDGAVKKDYTAREVTGEEKALWWERSVAAYPDYADYQEKTDREIPVFKLTPVE